jgi:hypothetical protein
MYFFIKLWTVCFRSVEVRDSVLYLAKDVCGDRAGGGGGQADQEGTKL